MKIVLNKQKLYMQMNQSLHRKYEDSFHFFQAKWINDILNFSHHNPHYQDFVDMRIDTDDVEFLKRFYYHKTPTGKLEIENRIKVCTEFYAKNVALMYEYPMMIVTNTKSLFTRRAKRMKKIQAQEGSSDETEQHVQENEGFSINHSNFLSQLSKSNMQDQFSFQKSQLSYEDSFYQIYQDSFGQKNKSLYKLSKLNEVAEYEVFHLIAQMGNTNSQFKVEIQMPSTSKQTLVNIQNQVKSTKQSGISITPIEERLSIRSKQKKSGILSSYLDFMLEKQVGYANIGLKFDNPAVNQYNSIHSHQELNSENDSLEKQKQERASRRQKIRQKAQELLKRARKDQQVQQRY